ncbi:hypothetical protein H6771_02130 [Candidatus Peribacteria bacterium]|nr:hypothetical protein [Candidatus Peribacteria bacterium]
MITKLEASYKLLQEAIAKKWRTFDYVVGMANKASTSLPHLVCQGVLPPFTHYYTASAGALEGDWTSKLFALETEYPDGPQQGSVWSYQPYWDAITSLCRKALRDRKKVLFIPDYAAHDAVDTLRVMPNVTVLSPPKQLKKILENKASLPMFYAGMGLNYSIPLKAYVDASRIDMTYEEAVTFCGSKRLVLQILQSAGGTRFTDGASSISFIKNEKNYTEAVEFHKGHGALRIMPFVEGLPSNSGMVITPHGTYFRAGGPSIKPVGLKSCFCPAGAGPGNDWESGKLSSGLLTENQYAHFVTSCTAIGTYAAKVLEFYGKCGLDWILSADNSIGLNNEINARGQGPDDQCDTACHDAGIPSMSMLALAAGLGVEESLFPDPGVYNEHVLAMAPGGYLKLFPPVFTETEKVMITKDLNGYWFVEAGQLIPATMRDFHDPHQLRVVVRSYGWGRPGQHYKLVGDGFPAGYVGLSSHNKSPLFVSGNGYNLSELGELLASTFYRYAGLEQYRTVLA